MKHEHTCCTHLGTQPIRFLDRGTQLVRPQEIISTAGRPEFEVMHCHCSNDITCKYFVYCYLTLLYQMRKFRIFVINVSLVPKDGDRQFAKRCSSQFTYTLPYFSHSTHFSGCLRMRGRRVHGMCAPLYFIKFLLVQCLIYEFTGRKM